MVFLRKRMAYDTTTSQHLTEKKIGACANSTRHAIQSNMLKLQAVVP